MHSLNMEENIRDLIPFGEDESIQTSQRTRELFHRRFSDSESSGYSDKSLGGIKRMVARGYRLYCERRGLTPDDHRAVLENGQKPKGATL